MGRDEDSLDVTAASAPPERGELARGTQLGRYVVLERVGAGGMGVVYTAYDPELDRKVALKLIRPTSSSSDGATEGRARLLREARAIARLSHPNVVVVHDVAVVDDEVVVAMELVDGFTLRGWLEARPRTLPEIVAMFAQAGRGLAAAHAAGLVHRDFKPDNVLVGKDERARVLDFGLVQAADAAGERAAPFDPTLPGGVLAADGDVALTRTGAWIGTPAYMAPEQLAGRATDARTDVFSFCVSLYEALYGERPFGGKNFAELARAVVSGRVRAPDPESRVPDPLRQILLRGLSVLPADRWPSMDALLAELERDPAAARRRRLAVVAIAAVAIAAAVGVRALRQQRGLVCAGAERKLAGVWDGARKETLRAAFLATGAPFAASAAAHVERSLDAWTRDWTQAHTDACEATNLRKEQSPEVLDLRMSCLSRRLDEVKALTALFARADAAVVERSVSAVESLGDVAACADAAALEAPTPPPRDPAQRARVDGLRAQLAEAKALDDAGRYADALARAAPIADAARALGYRPLEAEAGLLLGKTQEHAGRTKEAERTLFDAALAADAGHDDEAAALAWIHLTFVVGFDEARFAESRDWERQARAAVERAGKSEPTSMRLAVNLGSIRYAEGRYPEALALYREGLAVAERIGSPIYIEQALQNLGFVYRHLARLDDARASLELALAIAREQLGPDHPDVAAALNNVGTVYEDLLEYERALGVYRDALAIFERVHRGADHLDVAAALSNIGGVLYTLRRFAECRPYLERALALRRELLGPSHPEVANALHNLGELERAMGRFERAQALLDESLAMGVRASGADHPDVATTHYILGLLARDRGRYDQALAELRRALAIEERQLGADHPQLADALSALGSVWLAKGDAARAVPPLERAVALFDASHGDPASLAEARFLLARALWPRDRARAAELAAQARDGYSKRGEPFRREVSAVVAWSKAH